MRFSFVPYGGLVIHLNYQNRLVYPNGTFTSICTSKGTFTVIVTLYGRSNKRHFLTVLFNSCALNAHNVINACQTLKLTTAFRSTLDRICSILPSATFGNIEESAPLQKRNISPENVNKIKNLNWV